MSSAHDPETSRRQLQVLSLGLPRTGSLSMAHALTILGYRDVYHSLQSLDKPRDWILFDRAADACFSSLPSHDASITFSRADWDELWGPSEATTDAAGLFAPQLIAAYPDAKVILVTRDFDSWMRSMEKGIFPAVWGWQSDVVIHCLEPLLGIIAGKATRKMFLGYFEARNLDELKKNAKYVWERHQRTIREMVPPGQLLECSLGDGWTPLCEFLGKPVPDVEFPRLNDAEALNAKVQETLIKYVIQVSKIMAPWVVVSLAVGVGAWKVIRPQ